MQGLRRGLSESKALKTGILLLFRIELTRGLAWPYFRLIGLLDLNRHPIRQNAAQSRRISAMKRKTLTPGTKLSPYLVSNEIAQDFFGVTYLVTAKSDSGEGKRFQVREFFPASLSMRRFGKVYSARRPLKQEFQAAKSACGEVFADFEGVMADGLVPVLDHFESNNTHFLVSEFPPGETLGEIQQQYGELTPDQIRLLFDGIMPGLETLEERGILHGGISPDTVFRSDDGRPVLNMPTAPGRIGHAPIVGVPTEFVTAYTAPEWLHSAETETLTIAADIYSLSALAVYLLTGKPPLAVPARLEAMEAGDDDPFDWAAIDAATGDDTALRDTLKLSLSLIPEERPASYAAFREALIPPDPVANPVAATALETERSGFPRWAGWAAAAAVLIGIVSLFFVFPRSGGDTDASTINSAAMSSSPEASASGSDARQPATVSDRSEIGAGDISVKPVSDTDIASEKVEGNDAGMVETTPPENVRDELPVEPVSDDEQSTGMEEDLPEETPQPEPSAPEPETDDTGPEETTNDLAINDPEPEAEPLAREFTDCETCPEMVRLDAGRFMMGSPATESGRNSAEPEPTLIEMNDQFAIMKTEVTVGQFEAFMQATGRSLSPGCATNSPDRAGYWSTDRSASFRSPGFDQTGDHPAVCISRDDAEDYADWLSGETGEIYRLPTTEEWEYAARAGAGTAYFWGNEASVACAHANGGDADLVAETSQDWIVLDCSDANPFTAKTASFAPNSAGLYDMAGNAWEWVSDCAYEQDGVCRGYGLRGGSWASSPDQLRSAKRHSAPGAARYNTVGFRLVREID